MNYELKRAKASDVIIAKGPPCEVVFQLRVLGCPHVFLTAQSPAVSPSFRFGYLFPILPNSSQPLCDIQPLNHNSGLILPIQCNASWQQSITVSSHSRSKPGNHTSYTTRGFHSPLLKLTCCNT
jgi:hypothetical protein